MREYFKRFNITFNPQEGRVIFKNKINNVLFHSRAFSEVKSTLTWRLCNEIGMKFEDYYGLEDYFNEHLSFEKYLLYLQCMLDICQGLEESDTYNLLRFSIGEAIRSSPVDLGIRISSRKNQCDQIEFAGAPFLDEKLVDDILGLLQGESTAAIRMVFEKGLKEFITRGKDSGKLKNCVRDMQLACDEAMKYKFNDKNIGLKHLFKDDRWKALSLNDYQKGIYWQYNDYLDKTAKHSATGEFDPSDVENIIYLTGLFIRHVLQKAGPNKP